MRAAACAIGGAILGGLIAWIKTGLEVPPIGWTTALFLKILFGGVLGASATAVTILPLTRLRHDPGRQVLAALIDRLRFLQTQTGFQSLMI